MKQQRQYVLRKLINKGTWKIDAKRGIVKGKQGSYGHEDMYGYRRISATYNKKVYLFGVHEIILVSEGYDLTDKEVSFNDGDKTNMRQSNLTVDKKGTAAKRSLLESEGAWRNRLSHEQVQLIKNDLRLGLSVNDVAKKYAIKYKTISRIARGETFRNV